MGFAALAGALVALLRLEGLRGYLFIVLCYLLSVYFARVVLDISPEDFYVPGGLWRTALFTYFVVAFFVEVLFATLIQAGWLPSLAPARP